MIWQQGFRVRIRIRVMVRVRVRVRTNIRKIATPEGGHTKPRP